MNKGLLEKFSGAAAAYSVRLLNRQYTGALMKIRRVDSVTSQDNGEIFVFPDNTGWVSLNSKVVDPSHASEATTLGGFVNASGYTDGDKTTIGTNTQNAYVVVWKDQSGNSNDASQGTTTSQPQIISAGALIVENGKPAVQLDGTNDFLTASTSDLFGTNFSLYFTHRVTGGSARKFLIETTSTGSNVYNPSLEYSDSTLPSKIRTFSGSAATSTATIESVNTFDSSQRVITVNKQGTTNFELFSDGVSLGTATPPNVTGMNGFNLGTYRSANDRYFGGNFQEFIIYNADKSSNRKEIEEDINTAFNIYNNAPTPKKNSFLGKYPGAAAAYSTRNLTGKANQPLLKVRRELGTDTDTEETIYSSNNQLDTNQLLNFVNGVGEDPRPPLDISEGYGYSLRIVKSGYQGPLIEVRESSGNTTKDFYADSTGRINEQALLDFCGANDGHVSKWYNQSGVDRHLTSDAAANEPKIVESGVVVKDTLGNVALKFTNAGNEFLAIQDATAFDLQEQTIAMHFMSTALPASGSKRIIGVPQASGETFDASIRNNVSISATGAIVLTSQSTAVTLNNISQTVNSPSILTINFKGSDTSGTSNKTTQSTTLLPTTSVKGLSVGARFTGTATPDFLTSEVIQYTSAQIGDNKNEVEASLNKEYKIYGDAYVSTWYDQSTAASDNLLLDDNPDAAAAYSLRKLRELYQGSAINVRRGSDNATKDIGFTSSGELDINELINFCSGTDGFVTTWYNQAFTSKNELLLDTVEGSGAEAAYSVRQLSSTATECMVIRRSSDGKTRTIGFRDTHIDEAAIESFCSGTTCTVQTWKDQSGNSNDATQTTPASQPTIYTGGAIVKENGRVAVEFDGSNDKLINTSPSGFSGKSQSAFLIAQTFDANSSSDYSDFYWALGDASSSAGTLRSITQEPYLRFSTAVQDYNSYHVQNAQELFSLVCPATVSTIDDYDLYKNGSFLTPDSLSGGTVNDVSTGFLTIGTNTAQNKALNGQVQELILYNSDQSSNRTSIETNINNYYGIFSTNNAEQDVALSQPKIYDSSTGVITENGKPAVFFEAADQFDTSYQVNSNPLSVFVTAYYGGVGGQSRHTFVGVGSLTGDDSYQYFSLESWSNVGHKLWAGTGSAYDVNQISYSGNMPNTILTGIYNSSGSNLYANGTASSSNPVNTYTTGGTNYLQISHRNDTSLAKISEIVVYASDQSSRRLNIEGNINNHYRIYSLNDATQATALNQPKLVSNGRVILENGKPAVDFDGSNDNMSLSSTLFQSDANFSVFSIGKHTETTTEGGLYDLGGGSVIVSLSFNRGGSNRYGSLNYRSTTIGSDGDIYDQSQSLFTHLGTASTNDAFQDGVQATQSYTARGNFFNSIGRASSYFLNGNAQEFVIYNSDKSTDRTGIESNINGAFGIYWDGTQRGLLDDQPNAAAAYSVRALSSSYTGPLIEIRDGSGNTRDIYATYNGDLNETAIETFCSGTTCTVSKWYDQSGNANDASQVNAVNQPTIYASGAVVKENGKPAVSFDGGDNLPVSGTIYASPATVPTKTMSSVITIDSGADDIVLNFTDGTTVISYSYNRSSSNALQVRSYDGSTVVDKSATVTTGQQFGTFSEHNLNTASTTLYLNGSIATGTSAGRGDATTQGLSVPFAGIGSMIGTMQEIVFFDSDQSSNRTNIERDINQYFNIYTDPGVDRLLNKYPGAAAAYSLRKLNSQYTGPAVRVRRDSDSVHADVYFDRTATISKYSRVGVLSSSTDPIAAASTTTLQTFMGSNNGFVAVWYDQASSNDASQSSATAQPKIYDSADGVIVENGKPSLQFEGAIKMGIGSYSSLTEGELFISVRHITPPDNSYNGGWKISSQSQNMHWPYYNGVIYDNFGSTTRYSFTPSISLTQLNLYNSVSTSSEWTARLNTSVEFTSATNTVGFSNGVIGSTVASLKMSHNISEYILYDSAQSSANRSGIESNINTFYSIYAKPKKLLDQYGGAAAAYSLRSLQSNYTGPLVTVRRDSDGIEVDVYADLNGEFSLNSIVKNVAETTTGATQGTFNPGTPLVTLSQFVQGSPNCYVVEWKDQSGNGNHAAQVTAASQPKIYDSVTGVVTENGKPAAQFDGSDDFFESSAFSISDGSVAAAFVFTGGVGTYLHSQNGTVRGAYGTGDHFFIHLGTTPNVTRTNLSGPSGQALIGWRVNDGTTDLYENGTSVASETYTGSVNTGTTGLDIMQRNNNGSRINGRMQEIIYYGTNKGSDMPNIQSAINDYYNIY